MYILLQDLHDEPEAKLVEYNEQVLYIHTATLEHSAKLSNPTYSAIRHSVSTTDTVRDVQTDTKIFLWSRGDTGLGLNTHLE